MKYFKYILTLVVFFSFDLSFAQNKIKIGTLQYGSVNWELELIKQLSLDKKNNINVEIVQLASKNAAAVALQGNAVDLIVTDWFWVSRQRALNRMFSFVPHSMAAGGLIVDENSGIQSIDDLKGKKIGIAGGQVDKSWLIFRAFYQQKFGNDLINETKQIFGAPPLLNRKIEQGSFDAILTYWPYQARLLSKGFVKVINVNDIIKNLGINSNMPIIGWVFRDEWAQENPNLLENFINTSNEAKELMLKKDEVWENIKPIMKSENDKVFNNLRDIYREGIPRNFGSSNVDGASILYSTLSEIGGKALVGNSKEIAPGTFWLE
ncbi:MAG: ABC transporter substrate-binding protein [Rickettsiales bacterium]|nr:ABC transporter substrate-binding protein [Rickettsiales bacterium]OUV52949.1 MAG: hypothetical protein CBC87_06265 [Rickettsiales bacterium TMED127]